MDSTPEHMWHIACRLFGQLEVSGIELLPLGK